MIKLSFFCVLLTISSSALWGSLTVPASLTHEKQASCGEVYQGVIPILNKSDEPLMAKVCISDYLYNHKGETYFEPPGVNPRSNAGWLSLSHDIVEVPPQQTVQVSYSVKVPSKDDLKGVYWSLVLVEPVVLPTQLPEEERTIGLQTIVRYGIQVITQINETGEYDLKVVGKKMTQQEGHMIALFEVENTGTKLLDPIIKMDVFDLNGKLAGHFEGGKLRIFPTCSVKYEVECAGLEKGDYKALMILDGGDKGVFGAEYDLSI